MAIDIFSSREMTRPFVQEFKPRTFLQQQFVTRRECHETRTIQIDKVTGSRIMAVFSSPVSKGVPMRHRGMTTTDITPGYIKLRSSITPSDVQKRFAGEEIFATPGENKPPLLDRAERKAIEILNDMDNATTRREEYMTMTALTTGKVQIVDMDDEGNVVETREIDFGYHADHTPTPTIDWDDEGADIIGDLSDWAQLCAKNGNMTPNALVIDSAVAKVIMANATIQKFLDCRYANIAEMQIALDAANGVTDMGVLRGPGLTVRVYVYNEWYTDPADGTTKAIWPANKIMLGNTNARVEIHCRAIEDFDIGEQYPETNGANTLAIPRFAKSWKTKNPSVIEILMQAGPIVVPVEINAFLTAQVIGN